MGDNPEVTEKFRDSDLRRLGAILDDPRASDAVKRAAMNTCLIMNQSNKKRFDSDDNARNG